MRMDVREALEYDFSFQIRYPVVGNRFAGNREMNFSFDRRDIPHALIRGKVRVFQKNIHRVIFR